MRGLGLIVIIFSAVSCNPVSSGGSQPSECTLPRDGSTALKLDGGIERPADGSKTAAPSYLLSIVDAEGVVHNCTGTAVSSSTIITAAHCVSGRGTDQAVFGSSRQEIGLQVCISRNDSPLEDVCSPLIYYDSRFNQNEYDLAWVGFAIGTFKDFYELSSDPIAVGQKLLAVGYGPGSFDGPPALRYGLTSISSTASRTFLSRHAVAGTFDEIKLVPGDSGGPVLNQCKIIGVASKHLGTDLNVYVDLVSNRDFLKNVSGRVDAQKNAYVHFCGLSVVYDDQTRQQLCPPAGLNLNKFPIASARDHFPCGRQVLSLPPVEDATEPSHPSDSENSRSEGACQGQM